MGMQYEYDETGGTFLFFITTLFGLYLVPYTLYRLISLACGRGAARDGDRKQSLVSAGTIVFAVSWVIFAGLLFALSRADLSEPTLFDPYEVLGVPETATISQVKSAYRALSLKWHPDKNKGNEEEASRMFQTLGKAYKILTNEDAKAEWEMRGDTDGRAMTAGIALPKFITTGGNSAFFVAAYLGVLGVLVVFVWRYWRRSKNLLEDDVLQQNMEAYKFYLWKDYYRPAFKNGHAVELNHNDIVEFLYKSPEFIEGVKERETDGDLLKTEIKDFVRPPKTIKPQLRKALLFLYFHVRRMPVPEESEPEYTFVLQQSLKLLRRLAQLGPMEFALYQLARREFPKATTPFQPLHGLSMRAVEVSQMFMQGMWQPHKLDALSFSQLPHIDASVIARVNQSRKKKEVLRTLRDLLVLPETERRALLTKHISEDQYAEAMQAAARIPILQHHKIVVTPDQVHHGMTFTVTVTYLVRLGGFTDEQAANEAKFVADREAALAAASTAPPSAAAAAKKRPSRRERKARQAGEGASAAPGAPSDESESVAAEAQQGDGGEDEDASASAPDEPDTADLSSDEEEAVRGRRPKKVTETIKVRGHNTGELDHAYVLLLLGNQGQFVADLQEVRQLTRGSGDDAPLRMRVAFHLPTQPSPATTDVTFTLHAKSAVFIGTDIVEQVRVRIHPTLPEHGAHAHSHHDDDEHADHAHDDGAEDDSHGGADDDGEAGSEGASGGDAQPNPSADGVRRRA